MTVTVPPVLLVIGVHREELDFGRIVAADLDPRHFSVLAIEEGLSGRRPRPDEVYRYEQLHQALYLQILPHVRGRYRLLIDLHTGQDTSGPTADLLCADSRLRQALERRIADSPDIGARGVRVLPLGPAGPSPTTQTVIPRLIWDNPAFHYLGMEIYLPPERENMDDSCRLALKLLRLAVVCLDPAVGAGIAMSPGVRERPLLNAAGACDARPDARPGIPEKAPR